MNLFQKYGIKEVADVVFYSITPIGDEEFYTPVLYLDTLKVSTLEKSAEKVEAKGGKGNKRLITWNFGKTTTLNLEDALFSPASMSMIWGGKLNAKLSDYTSAIVKCNIANKYGEQHFSTKAYPSPALTDDEWELIFESASSVNYIPFKSSQDLSIYDKEKGAENRKYLIEEYIKRNRLEMAMVDYSFDVLIDIGTHINPSPEFNKPTETHQGILTISGYRNIQPSGDFPEIEDIYTWDAHAKIYDIQGNEPKLIADQDINFMAQWVDPNIEINDDDISTEEEKRRKQTRYGTFRKGLPATELSPIFLSYMTDELLKVYNGQPFQVRFNEDGKTYNSEQTFIEYIQSIESVNGDFNSLHSYEAISPKIIEHLMSKIDELNKIGTIDTDIHEVEVIDRMEKCIVKKKEGQKISTSMQKENLFRYYKDDKSSSYTIYYDAKTMLPLLRIDDKGKISGWDTEYKTGQQYKAQYSIRKTSGELHFTVDEIVKNGIFVVGSGTIMPDNGIIVNSNVRIERAKDQNGNPLNAWNYIADIVFEVSDEFTLKLGTVYYKWTRTVKRKEYEDDDVLGRTLVIDAETFPGVYRIVGETYIRNQKTGKDQRYQFTIFNANVSSDTSITLEAEGDPTTFSMQIDVLTPPNDIMMELKQYDVEDDLLEGGTRIVSQSSKYTYTPTSIEDVQIDEKNEEIY